MKKIDTKRLKIKNKQIIIESEALSGAGDIFGKLGDIVKTALSSVWSAWKGTWLTIGALPYKLIMAKRKNESIKEVFNSYDQEFDHIKNEQIAINKRTGVENQVDLLGSIFASPAYALSKFSDSDLRKLHNKYKTTGKDVWNEFIAKKYPDLKILDEKETKEKQKKIKYMLTFYNFIASLNEKPVYKTIGEYFRSIESGSRSSKIKKLITDSNSLIDNKKEELENIFSKNNMKKHNITGLLIDTLINIVNSDDLEKLDKIIDKTNILRIEYKDLVSFLNSMIKDIEANVGVSQEKPESEDKTGETEEDESKSEDKTGETEEDESKSEDKTGETEEEEEEEELSAEELNAIIDNIASKLGVDMNSIFSERYQRKFMQAHINTSRLLISGKKIILEAIEDSSINKELEKDIKNLSLLGSKKKFIIVTLLCMSKLYNEIIYYSSLFTILNKIINTGQINKVDTFLNEYTNKIKSLENLSNSLENYMKSEGLLVNQDKILDFKFDNNDAEIKSFFEEISKELSSLPSKLKEKNIDSKEISKIYQKVGLLQLIKTKEFNDAIKLINQQLLEIKNNNLIKNFNKIKADTNIDKELNILIKNLDVDADLKELNDALDELTQKHENIDDLISQQENEAEIVLKSIEDAKGEKSDVESIDKQLNSKIAVVNLVPVSKT